jgi:hypothetical protein
MTPVYNIWWNGDRVHGSATIAGVLPALMAVRMLRDKGFTVQVERVHVN